MTKEKAMRVLESSSIFKKFQAHTATQEHPCLENEWEHDLHMKAINPKKHKR
tara:strand:- start:777 stop:932 length:156 start_codon:yes stop_codon:yes gene_type:complete